MFIAGEIENGVRLSRFVESVTRDMPRSLLYKSFRNKRIKVNGKRGEADTRLSSGDVIELYINDEFFPEKPVIPAKKPPRRQPPVKRRGIAGLRFENRHMRIDEGMARPGKGMARIIGCILPQMIGHRMPISLYPP